MRILQISSARAFGGGERHFVDLTRGLIARGHDVHAAVRFNSPLRERLDHLPHTNIHVLPLRNSLDLPSAIRLARLARQHEVEIIHAHVARDYPLAAYASRLSAARLFITRHVLFPLKRTHRFALANLSCVIAVSGAVARSLNEQRLFPPDRIRVVLNGIDVERFEGASKEHARRRADSADAPAETLRVGTVGSLVENKGHDLFLRAAAAIASTASKPVEFLIVGDADPRNGEYRERLERLIVELNLGGCVTLLARWEDTALVLPTLDLFVSASHSEAFGLAMAEALACGVPVVATATEGAAEVVCDGVNGTIVPIGEAQVLAAAVLSLIEDEETRAAYSRSARDSARNRFNLTRMVEETEQVYLEILTASSDQAHDK